MAITFACEKCGKPFEVADELAGKRCRCKQCGHTFLIPMRSSRGSVRPESSLRSDAARPRQARPAPSPVDDDPYGIDDVVAPPKPGVDPEWEEFVLPKRPGFSPSPKLKKANSRGSSRERGSLPSWVPLAGLGVLGISFLFALFSSTAATVFVVGVALIGIGLVVVGSIQCLITPFREDIVCGLLYIFMPFYALYYLSSRWEDMKRGFVKILLGYGCIIGIALISPALSASRGAAMRTTLRDGAGLAREALANPPATAPGQLFGEHERIIRARIAEANESADLFTSIHDLASAQAAEPKLRELTELSRQLHARRAQIPALDTDDDRSLKSKYTLAFQDANRRAIKEGRRVFAIAGVQDVLASVVRDRPKPAGGMAAQPVGGAGLAAHDPNAGIGLPPGVGPEGGQQPPGVGPGTPFGPPQAFGPGAGQVPPGMGPGRPFGPPQAFGPRDGLRPPGMGPGGGFGPRIGQRPPGFGRPGGTMPPPNLAPMTGPSFRVVVQGIPDNAAGDAIFKRLLAILGTLSNGTGGIESRGGGRVRTYQLRPKVDLDAFAAAIDFGHARKVSDDQIDVVFTRRPEVAGADPGAVQPGAPPMAPGAVSQGFGGNGDYPADKLVITPQIGGNPPDRFYDLAPKGSILVGVRVSYVNSFGGSKVGSVQPLYRAGDIVTPGFRHGDQAGEQIEVVAKPGYAVGVIRTHTGLLVDGFELVFMKINGQRLDPRDSYQSPWLGDPNGGSPRDGDGQGLMAIGVCGRAQKEIQELGLIFLKP